MRLFAAIKLDDDVCDATNAMLPTGRDSWEGVTWVAVDSLHITLWFLGEVAEASVAPVSDVLRPTSVHL